MTDFKPWYAGLLERSALLTVVFLILVLFLPVAYFFGARTSELPEDRQRLVTELQERRDKWSASKPDNFQYLIRRVCFCGGDTVRPFKVVFSNGAMRILATDDAPVEMLPTVASVEDLFDVLEEAVREADRVRVEYHDEYAFPVHVRIDWSSKIIDEEDRYQVSNFEVFGAHID